jgi:hypothetical protein
MTHLICPIAMWICFLLLPYSSLQQPIVFKSKKMLKFIGYIIIYPILYVILVLIIGASTNGKFNYTSTPVSSFPYDFLNYLDNG